MFSVKQEHSLSPGPGPEDLKDFSAPVERNLSRSPGENAGMQPPAGRTKAAYHHNRLPLETQNSIFFSGLNN